MSSAFSDEDRRHMERALELARQGLGRTSPNPMVGAVIVKDGKTIGEGAHLRLGAPHAEIAAIVAAGNECRGATLYVTLEPCCHYGRTPPCVDTIARLGIARVVAAVEDPDPRVRGRGFDALRKARVRVDAGLLENEARRLNEVFFTCQTLQRPFFSAKWAMTLDGRIYTDTRSSKWVTNEASREEVHRIRGRHDAILVGVGTITQDNPRLNVRLKGYQGRQPARIVVDANLSSPLKARCFSRQDGCNVYLAANALAPPERITRAEQAGIKVLLTGGKRRIVDLTELAARLYKEGIASVLVEGGRLVLTSLFREGLADRVHAFIAPKLVGGERPASPLDFIGILEMNDALPLDEVEIRNFGNDIYVNGVVKRRDDQSSSAPSPDAPAS